MPVGAFQSLLEPLPLGRLEARNRIVFAPHVTNLAAGGVPGERLAAYYERGVRAGGAERGRGRPRGGGGQRRPALAGPPVPVRPDQPARRRARRRRGAAPALRP